MQIPSEGDRLGTKKEQIKASFQVPKLHYYQALRACMIQERERKKERIKEEKVDVKKVTVTISS